MTDVDDARQYATLTEGFGAIRLRRDVLRAAGDEVVGYLQGQLSQDIEPIEVGRSAWSWVLQPHGKVDALIRLSRSSDAEFIIDVDAGFGELVMERLNRFKLRTKVDFESLDWKVLALRGKAADAPAKADLIVPVDWSGFTGFDIFGPDPEVPETATVCDYGVYETLRIENGIPRMGSELDQLTIPAEAGINDHTISFSKGCYTGQELVARIDSRGGNVPRNLRVLVIESDEAPPRDAKIVAPGNPTGVKPYGTITSSNFSTRLGKSVALAFIRREIQAGAEASVLWDRGPSVCTIQKAPV